jgi:asparagine synthetase B (glutamine-hydrolysing)
VQEGLDAIPEVIYHLETYDVTTVRASTPMYLLSRKIKAMGVKMVLSGEGSDEILGGDLSPPSVSPHTIHHLIRVFVLPCCSRLHVIPPGNCPTREKPPHSRLSSRQQVSDNRSI